MGNCLKSLRGTGFSPLRGGDHQNSRRERPAYVEQPSPYRSQAELHQQMPSYHHQSPGTFRESRQVNDEEQLKVIQRLGFISHLPTGKYDGSNKNAKECVICMNEFDIGEQLRYLPCMHVYHKDCIDDWLMRSFICPSCLEPVDAALLSTYPTN